MAKPKAAMGYFNSGLPYNRFGNGPRNLVVFQGLGFENKPLSGLAARLMRGFFKGLEEDYTIYVVTRKPGLPQGYSMGDMSDDYANMIREEFGSAVDVIGSSTGGSIAQHFAADHPDLVRRLVIHSCTYRLDDASKALQKRIGDLARRRQWRAAYAAGFAFIFPRRGGIRFISKPALWLASIFSVLLFGRPADPSDLVVTVEAEDRHEFKDRLAEISAPTLVVAGGKDPFYPETLYRETAKGIPKARLILYEAAGHLVAGKRFQQDVLAFLKED